MSSVTMFSIVEVGVGDEERFIQFIKQIRAYFSKQTGFITQQLYRSQTASEPKFMVVGKWESSMALEAATKSEDWKRLTSVLPLKLNPLPFEEFVVE